jgi:4-carboxymuconolactone decarboxylase
MRLDILNPPYDPVDAERMDRFRVGDTDGEYVPLYSVRLMVGHHPDLAEGMRQTAWLFLDPSRSSLDLPTREIVVARTLARSHCEYQWGIHQAVFGAEAGFDEERRVSVVHGGPEDPVWQEQERVLLRAVDEVVDSSTLRDKTWHGLLEHLSPQQALEMLALIGWYQLNSYLSNAVQLPLENFAARFPPPPNPPY